MPPPPPAEHIRASGISHFERREHTLSDIDERTIGGLVVRIDRLLCVGFGDCIDEAAEAFELDDEGIAVFCQGADGTSRERLIAACDSCPVDAIMVHDSDGRQLAP